MSLFAPLFSSTIAASTLLTAAAQCSADLPSGRPNAGVSQALNDTLIRVFVYCLNRKTKPLTEIVNGIHVGVTVDELVHHALHRQTGSQDQGRGAIMHAGIQVCGTIPYQNLKRHRMLESLLMYNLT